VQKLKNRVLEKMMESQLTKAEVDFIIYISHYQDLFGRIYGVYYKDVCKAINVSYETFYVAMRSLVDKEIISVKKDYWGDWDITILDNDFSYPEAVKEGYVSTGHDIFYNIKFRELKANEKLLAMQFLKIAGAGKKNNHAKYSIGVDVFYEKYEKILQVSKRTLQVYLGKLKAFFSIGIKDKLYWIRPLAAVFKEKAPTDIKNFSGWLCGVAFRRNRATYTKKSVVDTADLIAQYHGKVQKGIVQVFFQAVRQSIEKVNESIENKYKWNREINPKFIHKIMRDIAVI